MINTKERESDETKIRMENIRVGTVKIHELFSKIDCFSAMTKMVVKEEKEEMLSISRVLTRSVNTWLNTSMITRAHWYNATNKHAHHYSTNNRLYGLGYGLVPKGGQLLRLWLRLCHLRVSRKKWRKSGYTWYPSSFERSFYGWLLKCNA